jgi:hypothetical protein
MKSYLFTPLMIQPLYSRYFVGVSRPFFFELSYEKKYC